MEKIVEKYLQDKLKNCSRYDLSNLDKKNIKSAGIEEYIYLKLTTKKYRKWKMAETCREKVKKAIQIAFNERKPLEAVFFIGAYKLWRLPSSPEADWAEFFNVAYLIQYLAPIAKAYKPGVVLTYYLHTLLMEKHDNLTTEEISAYTNSFQKIVDSFAKYLPKNFKLKILKDADIYPRNEYFKKLEAGVKIAEKQFAKLSDLNKKRYHKLGALNIKWKGKEDWSSLSPRKKEEKIYRGILYELAATSNLPKVMAKVKGDDKVCLFTNPTPTFISVGSTKSSVAKFWTGFGVLEYLNSEFQDRVLSPTQFNQLENSVHDTAKINLIEINNLRQIWIFKQKLDFSQK